MCIESSKQRCTTPTTNEPGALILSSDDEDVDMEDDQLANVGR